MSGEHGIVVLLVEDDDEDAAILCRRLERVADRTVSVIRASSETEALSRLAAEHVDLVFLDLNLRGGGSGMSLLKRMQAQRLDLPVIVVTGASDEGRAADAMKSGAYDYIPKDSLTAELLQGSIRNALKRHSLETERAQMVETLTELTVTDELTGLANRRYLARKLDEEVARAGRTGDPFALLMIDLDHFKGVNDQYGHQVGDEVLTRCAGALQGNVRKTDFVARYGGEEFCVVLVATPAGGALHIAEKVRNVVKVLPPPAVTISIGVASWKSRTSAEDMVARADKALYQAKAQGRDCVVVFNGGIAAATESTSRRRRP